METLVYRIYSGLDTAKYDLYICSLTFCDDNYLINKLRNIGCKVICLDFINKNIKLRGAAKDMIQFFKLCRLITKYKFDIVHSHDFFSAFFTRAAILFDRIFFIYKPKKVYVTLHNLFFWLKPFHHYINRLLSHITTNIICVSNSVADYSMKLDFVSLNKYIVIHNAIEPDSFYKDVNIRNSARRNLGFTDGDFLIGNVGTISIRKGQKYLIEAFAEINRIFPTTRLIIVGGHRNHEKAIEKEIDLLIEKFGLSSRVCLLAPIENINLMYNIFDIFIMPSITEGFSLSAQEAMLAECICIFSDIAPFKELINDGENGFLFQSQKVKYLIRKIQYVIENYDNLRYIGKNARSSIINKFNHNIMIKQYDMLYDTNTK